MPESPVVSQQPVDGGRRRGPAVAVRPRSGLAWPGLLRADRVSGDRSGYTQTHKQPQISLYLSKITDNSTGWG